MSRLTKNLSILYTPADPGKPGYPGLPAQPERWVKTCYRQTKCETYQVGWIFIPGFGEAVVKQPQYATVCRSEGTSVTSSSPPSSSTNCNVAYYPPVAAVPPTPPVPPTLAQLSVSFQEGWNASAQSVNGILTGKAFAFTIAPGTRGLLASTDVAAWTPAIGNARFGIMFNAGGFTAQGYPSNVTAVVWENGVLKAQLGTFLGGQTFYIGRSTNNKIVYGNATQGIQVTYNVTPTTSTVPIHLFSGMYLGGDTIYY